MSRYQFVSENGAAGTPLDMKNQAKPLEGSQKSGFAFLYVKWLYEWVLGPFLGDFGAQVGAKLGHVGHQVGLQGLLNITPKIVW